MSNKKEVKFSIDPERLDTVKKALEEFEDGSLKDVAEQIAGGQWFEADVGFSRAAQML